MAVVYAGVGVPPISRRMGISIGSGIAPDGSGPTGCLVSASGRPTVRPPPALPATPQPGSSATSGCRSRGSSAPALLLVPCHYRARDEHSGVGAPAGRDERAVNDHSAATVQVRGHFAGLLAEQQHVHSCCSPFVAQQMRGWVPCAPHSQEAHRRVRVEVVQFGGFGEGAGEEDPVVSGVGFGVEADVGGMLAATLGDRPPARPRPLSLGASTMAPTPS